jgi:hypothetical protein
VILRVESELTSKDYITQRGWESTNLAQCPLHPRGGCGIRRHTSYTRRNPAGLVVPRWYCREGHTTFSLVPDFAASRVSDSLPAIEATVLAFEAQRAAGATVAGIAESLRPDIELQGAVRWLARRRVWVAAALTLLVGIAPQVLAGLEQNLTCARTRLATPCVLVRVRKIAAVQLPYAPAPLGFSRLRSKWKKKRQGVQHKTGADPPGSRRL